MEERYTVEIQAFGRRLKQLREAKGWSQLDLDVESGINRTEISRIENGRKNISFFTIIKLASALNIDLIELFRKE